MAQTNPLPKAFTPGPWQAKGDYTIADATTIIANVDGDTHSDGSTTYSYEFIATCEDEYGERSERAEANARLIRTAPELYDALFWIVGNSDLTSEVNRRARVAIAKAQVSA